MGQKVSPNGLRLGINKDWEARWYASSNDFADTLARDLKIREFIEKNLKNAGIAKVEIDRTPKKCEVTIHTSKPGVIIGRGGEEITKLNNEQNAIMIAENIIKTKGVDDLIILVNGDSVNVVVGGEELEKETIAQIQNIITRELGTDIGNIHIMNK